MIPAHFLAIAIGFFLDRIIGDPEQWPHPVRWIGQFISKMTKWLNRGRYRTAKGAFLMLITVGIVFIFVFTIVIMSYDVHIFFGIAVEAVLIAIGLAQKSLKDAAMAVHTPLQQGDLTTARKALSYIVGRDTERLQEQGIARATIETVSENTADGITSPLFWAFLFGAPGLWVYKAINTLDSMVGYQDERYAQFGKVSAKIDDLFNYIPARLTGLFIISFTKSKTAVHYHTRLKKWWIDAKRHVSPNSGYLEAATAWQLGIELGGASTYRGVRSDRAKVGPNNAAPTAAHIQAAIKEMSIVSFIFWLIFTGVGVVFHVFT